MGFRAGGLGKHVLMRKEPFSLLLNIQADLDGLTARALLALK